MEELLGMIAGVEEEEDLLVKMSEAVWLGTSLHLKADVSVVDSCELGTWVIQCEYVLAHMLGSGRALSLELADDHPLLWEFKFPSASAFFSGAPFNCNACVGTLYEAHARAVGCSISFGAQLNSSPRVS